MTTAPFAATALAAVALAALYALHCLKTQPTRRPVATLLFWGAVARAQNPRVLWRRRFAHPKTFALLAAFVLLVAGAIAVTGVSKAGPVDVMVVDAGASSRRVGDDGRTLLEAATALARADLAVASDAPRLVVARGVATRLTPGDEPGAVVDARLAGLHASDGAPASTAALLLAGQLLEPGGGSILWYTEQSAPPDGLPEALRRRVVVRQVRPPAEAAAIAAVTYRPDPADPRRGTLVVRVAGRSARPMTLHRVVPGQATDAAGVPVFLNEDAASVDIPLPGVPADGSTVTLRLEDAPGAPATHTAAFRLPRRTALHFRCVAPPPAGLAAALRAIGTIETGVTPNEPGRTADAGPETVIAVLSNDDPVPAGSGAAVRVVGPTGVADGGTRSAVRVADSPVSAGLPFDGAAVVAGRLPPLPGEPLLTAGGQAVASLAQGPSVPTLYLSRSILTPDAEVPRRAEFPVLLLRSCATLAGWSDASTVETALRAVDDPLWPPGPGRAAVVFAEPASPPEPRGPVPAVTAIKFSSARHVPWAAILLVSALALITFEGVLLAARRIV